MTAGVDMRAELGTATVPNPVLTAAGCAGAGREMDPFSPVSSLGAVVTASLTLDPCAGVPPPRLVETPSGVLSSVGLQNPGVDAFLAHDLPWLAEHGGRAVVSLAGGAVGDYAALARRLVDAPALVAVEVNLSCADAGDPGRVFAGDPVAAARVIAAVRAETPAGVPVLAKLSPDVADIVAVARACAEAGADGLSLVNTPLGMVIDPDTLLPALAGGTGGLSGPAIRPVAVRCVWQVHAALPDVPILGAGGIATGLDALQFVLAGASAFSVGTAVFADPAAPVRILGELHTLLEERSFARLADAVGYAHRPGSAGGQHRAKVGDEHRPRPAAPARPAWVLGEES